MPNVKCKRFKLYFRFNSYFLHIKNLQFFAYTQKIAGNIFQHFILYGIFLTYNKNSEWRYLGFELLLFYFL